MGVKYQIHALSGLSDSPALSYVLQVEEFVFLLDCGLDDVNDTSYLEKLKQWAPKLNAVLLTYADMQHAGALPYLAKRCKLSCPVYATVPVYRMGQMFLYDWCQAVRSVEDLSLYTLDDVDDSFENICKVMFTQVVTIKGQGQSVKIEALRAGRMIGGCIWRIEFMGEEIIYAVDFNHRNERHLNGCSFETIYRPSLLITDAYSFNSHQASIQLAEEALLATACRTLETGGNCLIVSDTAGRVLELIKFLDEAWLQSEFSEFDLRWMSFVAQNVQDFAKCMTEWMSDDLLSSYQNGATGNPFNLKHVQMCNSLADLRRINRPVLVVASVADMETGYSREIFIRWCSNPRNSVILTSKSKAGTLAARLIEMAEEEEEEEKDEDEGPPDERLLTIEVKRRIPLKGDELETYKREKKRKRHVELRARYEAKKRISRVEIMKEESDPEVETELEADSSEYPFDVMYNSVSRMRAQQPYGISVYNQPVFRHSENKIKWDDYGELVHRDQYASTETRQLPVEAMREIKTSASHDAASAVAVSRFENYEEEMATKCTCTEQTLTVRCKLDYVNFEGRAESDSIKKILQFTKPRHVVILHGKDEAAALMAQHCFNVLQMDEESVFNLTTDHLVEATMESLKCNVVIEDQLMASLKFVKTGDVDIAWIDAQQSERDEEEQLEEHDSENGDEQKATSEHDGAIVLKKLPNGMAPARNSLFISELKLSSLKQALIIKGYNAEFVDDVLIVENVIALRKLQSGKLLIEGSASEDFFTARDIIYEHFAIV